MSEIDEKGAEDAARATAEAFELLLSHLAPERDAAGREYERLRARLANYFRLKGHDSPFDAADLTLDRTAHLISIQKVEDVFGFALNVARFVFLEQQRIGARQNKAQIEFSKANSQNDDAVETLEDLGRCFAKLPADERRLLEAYFADVPKGERLAYRTALAEKRGMTLNHLRLRVHRLRKILEECVRRKNKM